MTERKPTQIDEHGEVQQMLIEERPLPRAAFRAELRRSLLLDRSGVRPRRLRLLIAAYAGSGALLIAVAAIGLAGVGPLAA